MIKKLKLPKGKESDDNDPEIFSHFLTNLMFCNEQRAPEDSPQNDNIMKSMAAFEACFGSQGFAYKLALATNRVSSNLQDKWIHYLWSIITLIIILDIIVYS